jgi:fucose 4-O-acetylase-like acetyltransferase
VEQVKGTGSARLSDRRRRFRPSAETLTTPCSALQMKQANLSNLPGTSSECVWLKASQGLAISLIVFGHVLGGVMARGWLNPHGVFEHIYKFLYLFHVQLYFTIAGLLCVQALRKSRFDAFLCVTGSVLWPYLLWLFLIGTAIEPLIAVFVSVPPSAGWLSKFVQALDGELSWFLWTLYVMQVILIIVARVPIWLLFVVSVAAALSFQGAQLGTFKDVIGYMPFILLGAMLEPWQSAFAVRGKLWPAALSLMGLIVMAVTLVYDWTAYRPIWIACGIVGSLASVCLVTYISNRIVGSVLANLGMASVAIFVLHPYFQGAARELSLRVLGPSPYWQLTIPTIIALLGPFLGWRLAQALGMPWLFRLALRAFRQDLALP